MVTIPRRYAEEHDIKEGDRIELPPLKKLRKRDLSWIGSMADTGLEGWSPELKEYLRGNDRDF